MAAKWAKDLERAGLTLNTREYFALRTVVGVVLVARRLHVFTVPVLALLGLPLGFFAVGFWLKRRINSRLHKLEAQVVELLQMVSSGLRAGFGLVQALEAGGRPTPVAAVD